MTISRNDLDLIRLILHKEMFQVDMKLKNTKNKTRRKLLDETLTDLGTLTAKVETTIAELDKEIEEKNTGN